MKSNDNKYFSLVFLLFLNAVFPLTSEGQADGYGIHADSSLFVDWALICELKRGPVLISYPDSILVSHGIAADACGKAGDGRTVSLGDGGMATLKFNSPIINGPGVDFAVFENSFDGEFLELGFVEVSSDGENFVRFPSQSLTPVDHQIGPFDILDPEGIQNLAGKYQAGWGTPFELSELSDSLNLDLKNIVAVRVIDVIGILDDSLGTKDASGRLINDPFPTPFESGGFDLDAVGVIHQSNVTTLNPPTQNTLKVYPNPFMEDLFIEDASGRYQLWSLYDASGRKLRTGMINESPQKIEMLGLQPGTYIMKVEGDQMYMVLPIMKTIR